MGMISRFTDIMSANINSVLNGVEAKNADKLLEKYLNDAKHDLQQVKSEAASVIAEETAAQRKLRECNEQIYKYNEYAEQAVLSGNDLDAMKFLEAKARASDNQAGLEQRYLSCKANSEQMRQMTSKLMGDIDQAQQKLTELKGKLNVAKSTEKINKLNEKIGGSSLGNFGSMEDAIQKRLDEAQAKTQLNNSLSDVDGVDDLMKKYAKPTSTGMDSELAALKAKLGK